MKLDKSTKIFINLVLILVIGFLVKSLIIMPKDVYAKPGVEYKITNFDFETKKLYMELGAEKFAKMGKEKTEDKFKIYLAETVLNQYAKKGWRLHSVLGDALGSKIIFEN